MGKYEQIQTRKAISSYGGVGSIIETRDGSIIIKPFDEWPFFISIDGNFQEHNNIEDVRFKNRLSKYFINLERLVKIPVNDLKNGFQLQNGDENTLAASYFPEWFYCSSCNKFDKISNWKYNWLNNVEINHRDNFFPPKCYKCYARNRNSKRKFFDLEQVRFILTAPNGEIADIPWDKWSMLKRQKRDNSNVENKEIDTNDETISLSNIDVPSDLVLEYRTSDKLDDLSGINIIAKNDKGETLNFTTLSGLFNLRIKNQELIPNTELGDILFKPVIRSSNSVYYPNILSSIYIPAKDELNKTLIDYVKESHNDGDNPERIAKDLKRNKNVSISDDTIKRLIDNDFIARDIEISKSENEYRYDEFKYITEKGNYEIKDLLIFDKIDSNYFQNDLIKSIFRMDKIKFTSVQTMLPPKNRTTIDKFLR